LRSWRIKGFPCVIFYFECDDRVDMWRVLHGRRDIPSWLQDEG
jgi:toxin ParE1/3/4